MEIVEARNRRALMSHFTDVLSPLMVFTVEETVNPFQQLVLPMSARSPPLLNAILALSCAHLEYRGIFNEEKSLDFHTRALQELGETIKNNDASDEILAAIVMLIYYEVVSGLRVELATANAKFTSLSIVGALILSADI